MNLVADEFSSYKKIPDCKLWSVFADILLSRLFCNAC